MHGEDILHMYMAGRRMFCKAKQVLTRNLVLLHCFHSTFTLLLEALQSFGVQDREIHFLS